MVAASALVHDAHVSLPAEAPFVQALRTHVARSDEFQKLSAALYAQVREALRTDGLPAACARAHGARADADTR